MELEWVKKIKDVPLVKRYAQFCEENIFDYIFQNIGTTNKYLVDFGANGLNQGMSNSKYLLDCGWTGLLMDGDNSGNDMIKKEFITAKNIVSLFEKYEVPDSFDLLSVDIDGMDYYVLDSILENGYCPRVIISEFNGCVKNGSSQTIEYNENHIWGEDDYYGFSFSAGQKLMAKHGYTLVYQTGTTNMIFISSDIVPQADYGITYTASQYHKKNTVGKWIMI